MTDDINDQLVMISGASTTGKSASLQNMRGGAKNLYLNCEAGKRLPFRNEFSAHKIVDPHQVYEAFDHAGSNTDYTSITVDTSTFLMDMYESMYVLNAENTMKAWGDYQQYFKNLMQIHVANSDKAVIFMAHTRSDLNEKTMTMETMVPVKGALKNNGIEAYFSTVVSTKKVTLKDLENQDPKLLNITQQDETLGYKHVFQTQLTKETVGERIRSPMGMFASNQVYMDNDAQMLLDHLASYYA
jgi:hypothetical protein